MEDHSQTLEYDGTYASDSDHPVDQLQYMELANAQILE